MVLNFAVLASYTNADCAMLFSKKKDFKRFSKRLFYSVSELATHPV